MIVESKVQDFYKKLEQKFLDYNKKIPFQNNSEKIKKYTIKYMNTKYEIMINKQEKYKHIKKISRPTM